MKLWLTKLRISAALDAGKLLPESLRKKIAADPELEHFVRQTQLLETRLRIPQSGSPDLHEGIMRAVRASARRDQPRRVPVWSWLAASASLAALALACSWLVEPRPAPPSKASLDAPLAILDMSEKAPVTVPPAVVAPLSNEWAKVNHDIRGTAEIVASTFPFQAQ